MHLHQRFERPPKKFSPVPIWWWSGGRLKRDRLLGQLARFVEGGVFNVCIIHFTPTGWRCADEMAETPLFSEAWWSLYADVCAVAQRLGIKIWFFDHIGFGGTERIADMVRQRPEFSGQLLRRGPCPTAGTPLTPAVYTIEAGFDFLQPAVGAALIDLFHGEHERRLGKYFGSVIVGSFQDELLMMPTWSAGFADAFRQRRGYDLIPHLAALWEEAGADANRIRSDYHRTRAELAEEAFFNPLYEWHATRGLIGGCDQLVRDGRPIDSTRVYADYPRTHRWFGAPGSDQHGDAKIHSSLAHLYDRPRVWIEAFHTTGWGGTLEETFDWLLPWLRAGANLYNPHAVYYDVRGGWEEWAPPSTCWRQPYWRHYQHFAATVSRLCAVLSQGHHVCDIGVLYPTTTVQAGLTFDGPTAAAQAAHDTYRALVGRMCWYEPQPGVLDRDRRDFDVLDEDSVQRAVVQEGALRIGHESYRVVILPACATLAAGTEEKLREFAAAGGRLIAVGSVAAAEELPAALADFPRRVDAPVPTLWRRVDDADILFIPAAYPGATRINSAADWRRVDYRFDPDAYARRMTIAVRGVADSAELWDPTTGERVRLETTRRGNAVEVTVPFENGPAALVVFGAALIVPPSGGVEKPNRLKAGLQTIDGPWDVEYVPTGADDLPLPVECWEFEHRVEPADQWQTVHATFGTYGWWRLAGEEPWRPAVYSLSRGIHKDRQHLNALGVHGRVPEEFLDFGWVEPGQTVEFRTTIHCDAEHAAWLAVAAPTAKQAWLNGERLGECGPGYQWVTPVRLRAGRNALELRFNVERERTPLTAFYAFVSDPARFARPDWITVADGGQRHSVVAFTRDMTLSFDARDAQLQVMTNAPARLVINGDEVARQGGFKVTLGGGGSERYNVGQSLRRGRNRLEVQLVDPGAPVAALVDGLIEGDSGEQVEVMTDVTWVARRDGKSVETVVRRGQWGKVPDWGSDPSVNRLWQRPHPLPATGWLDPRRGGEIVLPVQPDAFDGTERVEWFRFRLPPGATEMQLEVAGEMQVTCSHRRKEVADSNAQPDVPLLTSGATTGMLRVPLPDPDSLDRICTLRLVPAAGRSGGAVFGGPVTFKVGRGRMSLGDWQHQGLAAYSGGLTYRHTVRLEAVGAVVLDLGEVRGTAEVAVNGQPAGVRVWSPYRFEIGHALRAGDNQIEITVFNTLGPYLAAASPTPYVFPGQTRSGMFGPVRLLWGTSANCFSEPCWGLRNVFLCFVGHGLAFRC